MSESGGGPGRQHLAVGCPLGFAAVAQGNVGLQRLHLNVASTLFTGDQDEAVPGGTLAIGRHIVPVELHDVLCGGEEEGGGAPAAQAAGVPPTR